MTKKVKRSKKDSTEMLASAVMEIQNVMVSAIRDNKLDGVGTLEFSGAIVASILSSNIKYFMNVTSKNLRKQGMSGDEHDDAMHQTLDALKEVFEGAVGAGFETALKSLSGEDVVCGCKVSIDTNEIPEPVNKHMC